MLVTCCSPALLLSAPPPHFSLFVVDKHVDKRDESASATRTMHASPEQGGFSELHEVRCRRVNAFGPVQCSCCRGSQMMRRSLIFLENGKAALEACCCRGTGAANGCRVGKL